MGQVWQFLHDLQVMETAFEATPTGRIARVMVLLTVYVLALNGVVQLALGWRDGDGDCVRNGVVCMFAAPFACLIMYLLAWLQYASPQDATTALMLMVALMEIAVLVHVMARR